MSEIEVTQFEVAVEAFGDVRSLFAAGDLSGALALLNSKTVGEGESFIVSEIGRQANINDMNEAARSNRARKYQAGIHKSIKDSFEAGDNLQKIKNIAKQKANENSPIFDGKVI